MSDTSKFYNFESGLWEDEINVRDFIVKNYTPYDDGSFLTSPTKKLLSYGKKCVI